MQIVALATGTRGDVQPMIALGQALRRAGHRVRVVAGSNYVRWIETHGLEAFGTVDSAALMHSEAGIRWVESAGGIGQLRAMKALARSVADRVVDDTIQSTKGADLLIGGFVEEPYLQAIAEKHAIGQITFALQPYRPTMSAAASLVPLLQRTDSVLNRWSGLLAQRLVWSIGSETTNRIRTKLELPSHSWRSYLRAEQSIPALYAFSPNVVPPVPDANAQTTGYCFLDQNTPLPDNVLRFIQAADEPIYLGFGSMSDGDPARTLHMVSDALARLGRRGVVALDSKNARLEAPDHVCLVNNIEHAALFPSMAAVVHHGGAGTTAACLRAGKPALIVPHMADQPFWARRIHELGVGVKPIQRRKLTAGRLAHQLAMLLGDTGIAAKAAALGECIRAEQGVATAVEWIEQHQANSQIGVR